MSDFVVRFGAPVTVKNEWCRMLRKTEGTLFGLTGRGVGIDPGVNFGLVFIDGEKVTAYHGSLKRETEPGRYGLVAYRFLQSILPDRTIPVIIEGAAYGAPFRQVLLEEVRIGLYLYVAMSPKSNVKIVPPPTIRKKVLSDGRAQASDQFPVLNHNAADALSMALYAIMV